MTMPRNVAPVSPTFSIVIPTFHASEKLSRTLRSLTAENAEIVVVDGGMDPETQQILQNASNLRLRWISEKDTGVYAAMNKGIDLTTGDFLLFLGAGDRLRPGILQKILPFFPETTGAFVYGNAFMEEKGVVWDGPWEAAKFQKRNICHQAIFYGRDLFKRVGRFDPKYPILADYALNIRCFGDSEIQKIFLDEIICDYEGNGLSASTRDEKFYADRPGLLQQYLGIAPQSPVPKPLAPPPPPISLFGKLWRSLTKSAEK